MSGMTDDVALADSLDQISACSFGGPYSKRALPEDVREVMRCAAARLRGEAAQGGQQVVAWFPTNERGELIRNYGDGSAVFASETREKAEQTKRCHLGATGPVVPLYTRPQPVAVAGDAVRALVGSWDARAKSEHEKSQDKTWAEWLRDRHHGASGAFSACKLELESALSATPAATVDGKVVVREAALRIAIRELNHARKGIESAGRANYVHRLLLAMLGQEPIHDVAEPAAPAPVAGDAVDFDAIQHILKHALRDGVHGGYTARFIEAQIAALAQDRASQAGALDLTQMVRNNEAGVMRSLADRIAGNAAPDEYGRLEVAYAIARHLGLDWPAASQAGAAGAGLIAKERGRQISVEGWSADHDDAYEKLELVRAAVAYALYGVGQKVVDDSFWPWHLDWWKPSDRVRNLVKAGALIAAEIDRLNRAAAPTPVAEGEVRNG